MIIINVYYYVDEYSSLFIEFKNGCYFSVPTHLIQELVNANIVTEVPEITSDGLGLYWENLDINLNITELLQSIFK